MHRIENTIFNNVTIVLGVFTDPLLRNGLHIPVVILLRACMLRTLPSKSRCLHSHCLARGLYTIIFQAFYESKTFITMFTKASHEPSLEPTEFSPQFYVQFL
jgi:hypothetical protein